jgi:aryl-alcohol dehydrogenase-like predicted oxidoreductase
MSGTPIEEVAEAMGHLIDEGLIRGWGLSQVDVDVISRAQAVCPLSAIQNIYSMVERDCEDAVIPYCLENRIGLVPFSPIASGLLSGKVRSTAQFERVDDVRTWVPQLSERNLAANKPLVDMLEEFAATKGCTPAQLSMAWMLAKWDNVVPIPGSKNKGRILENLGAAEVELTADELAQLETALDGITVYGHRGFTR